MAADTDGYLFSTLAVALHGPTKGLLSAQDPDQFRFLQMNLDDVFMLSATGLGRKAIGGSTRPLAGLGRGATRTSC